MPPAVEVQSLNHWTAREDPNLAGKQCTCVLLYTQEKKVSLHGGIMDVFHIFPLYFPVISFLKKNKEPALLKQSVGGGKLTICKREPGPGHPWA